jgi:hypothetical protein
MTSAVSTSSDPYQPFEEKDVRPGCSSRESDRGVRMKNGIATGVSEARSHQRRGSKTPTLVTPGREAIEHEDFALNDDPPKRSRMS